MAKLDEKVTAAANAATALVDSSITKVTNNPSTIAMGLGTFDMAGMKHGLSESYSAGGR